MADGEFSVYQFFTDESYEPVLRFVDAETAVKCSTQLIKSIGAKTGTVIKVIITDGGDFTNFEWQYGKGVIYPQQPAKETKQ